MGIDFFRNKDFTNVSSRILKILEDPEERSRVYEALPTLFVMTKTLETSARSHDPEGISSRLYAICAKLNSRVASDAHYISHYGVVLAVVVHFGSYVLKIM